MQITLFIGVIEKGREALFKNLFLFFRWRQNSWNCGQNAKAPYLPESENPPTLQYMCIIFHNRTSADMKYYARAKI